MPTPFDFVVEDHFRFISDREQAKALFAHSVVAVELEVFSYCNRRCWFCPNVYIDRISANHYMDEGLYINILKQMAEIDYSNGITYSRYNEPLADRIIIERMKQAKQILPKVHLHTNTNGDYLKPDYLDELYDAGLRSMNIQVYLKNDEKYNHEKMREKLSFIARKLKLPETPTIDRPNDWLESTLEYKDMKIRIYARNFDENGCSRGDTLDIKREYVRTSPCLSPFYHLYVDYNGKVVPCCNIRSDVPEHANCVVEDLSEHPDIFMAFANSSLVKWRRGLVGFSEKKGVCKNCAFVPHVLNLDNMRKQTELQVMAEMEAMREG